VWGEPWISRGSSAYETCKTAVFQFLKWHIFSFDPGLGDELETAESNITPVRISPSLDFETLAVWLASDDEQAHSGGITLHIVQHLVPRPPIHCTNKDIRFRLNEPAFQHPPDGRWRVLGNEDGHGRQVVGFGRVTVPRADAWWRRVAPTHRCQRDQPSPWACVAKSFPSLLIP